MAFPGEPTVGPVLQDPSLYAPAPATALATAGGGAIAAPPAVGGGNLPWLGPMQKPRQGPQTQQNPYGGQLWSGGYQVPNSGPQQGQAAPAGNSGGMGSNAGTPGIMPNAATWFGGPGPQYFPGPTQVGMNDIQHAGYGGVLEGAGMMGQAAGGLSPYVNDYLKMFGNVTQGAITPQDYLTAITQGQGSVNPYTKQLGNEMLTQMNENFQQNVIPSIRGNATLAGQPGSSRQGIAEGLAASNYSNDASNALAKLYYDSYAKGQDTISDAYKSGLGYQANIASLGGNILNSAAIPGQMMGNAGLMGAGVGGVYQGSAQDQLNAEIARWNFMQQRPIDMMNAYGGIIGGNYGGTSTQSQGGGGFNASGALGGAATGAAMGAMGGPFGIAGGAILGGIGGAFG